MGGGVSRPAPAVVHAAVDKPAMVVRKRARKESGLKRCVEALRKRIDGGRRAAVAAAAAPLPAADLVVIDDALQRKGRSSEILRHDLYIT